MAFEKGNEHAFQKGHEKIEAKPEVKAARLKLKAMINNLLIDEFDNFQDAMEKLKVSSPKGFCQIYVDMLAYSLPKISTIAFVADDESVTNPATSLLREIANYNKQEK